MIESLLWTRDGGYWLLEEHLARLAGSAATLGFVHDEKRVRRALDDAVSETVTERLRVRLVLSRDGALDWQAEDIAATPADTVWRVALSAHRLDPDDRLLRHKTTRRAVYEGELARARQGHGADETLFLNTRGQVCEGARSNVFVACDDGLLTPPLSCGLLAGTLRARLLDEGRAREAIVSVDDVRRAERWFMGNAVRGLVRAALIEAEPPP